MIKNINISPTLLGKHFNKSRNTMSIHKSKYFKEESIAWSTFVKAYNYDIELKEKEDEK